MNPNAQDRRSSPGHDHDGDLLDLSVLRHWVGFVLRSAGRHKVLAGLCFLAVAALTLVALRVMPFRYQVQAVLLTQRNPVMGSLSNPSLNREQWDAPTRAASEIVLRRDNLVRLCKETNFVERYLASRAPIVRAAQWVSTKLRGHPPSEEELLDGMVDALESRLWVVVNGSEGTVTITFQWSNPELAYSIVAAAVQGFVEARHAQEMSAVGETIAILEGHDARLQQDIAGVSKALEEKERSLRASASPRRSAAPRPVVVRDESVAKLEAQLSARRRALNDLEDFRQRRLAELQSQLTQELTVYAPEHPIVIGTRQNVQSLSKPSPQIEALRAEVEHLSAEVSRRGGDANVQAQLDASYLQAQAEQAEERLRLSEYDPRLEVERNQLSLLLRQHSNLLERIATARVEMDTTEAAFKYRYIVTNPPQLPRGPIKPKPIMVLVGGLLGGVLFALFACAVVDLRRGRVLEAWQIERGMDVPVLGELRR